MRNHSIGAKLLVILLLSSLVPIVLISALCLGTMRTLSAHSLAATTQLGARTSANSEAALLSMAEEYLQKISREQSLKTDLLQQRVQSELLAMADYLCELYRSAGSLPGKALPLPHQTEQGVFSAKYMLAPGVLPAWQTQQEVLLLGNAEAMLRPVQAANSMMSNVYLGTPSGISYRFSKSNAYDESYDPRLREWYLQAVLAKGAPVWTQTYVDAYGIVCATNAVAYYADTGALLGVVAVDVTLAQLQHDITQTKLGEKGYAFLVDNTGSMIVHPQMTLSGTEKASFSDTFALFSEENGLLRQPLDGVECYLAYHKLPATGWYMVIVAEVEEIVQPTVAMARHISSYVDDSRESIRAAMTSMTVQFVIVIAAAALVVIVTAACLTKTITTPLHTLVHTVNQIGKGNLELQACENGKDEIAGLAKAFNRMTHSLQQHIGEIASLAAERQRAQSELQVAARIQTGMLPAQIPVLPENCRFSLCASLQMAKQVGGDFYDYFLLDATRLCVCMADVSGKGVPAALFMARAKAQLQSCVLSHSSLSEAVEAANNLLVESNDESMFVTLFAGILDTQTGAFEYVNAGHNPPLLQRTKKGFGFLPTKKNMVLAALLGLQYPLQRIKLKPGERLLLYTDGVTEGMNASKELYGEQRLLDAVNAASQESLSGLLTRVRESLAAFVQEAPQADDITLLALEWH